MHLLLAVGEQEVVLVQRRHADVAWISFFPAEKGEWDGRKRLTMIVRVWRGRTSVPKADEYERFLKDMAQPDYGDVGGNRGWMLLRRRTVPDAIEFMFVSFWDSMEALVVYTGGDPHRPKYYPEDRAALLELPEEVEHYSIVDLQPRW